MNGSFLKIRFSSEICLTILILYLWVYETVVRYVSIFIGHIPYIGKALQNYMPVTILIFLMLLSIKEIIKNIRLADIIVFLIVMFSSSITLFLNLKINEAFTAKYIYTFIFTCFPLYFLGLSFVKHIKQELLDKLYTLSIIAIYLSVFMTYRSGTTLVAEWSADMYLAYLMLPHALLAFLYLFSGFKPLRLLHCIVSFIYMFLMGNRGSLFCLLFFIFVIFLLKYLTIKSNKRVIMTIVLSILTMITIYSNLYDLVLNWLYSFALSHNMSIRVILSFQSNSGVTLDSGRFQLYQKIIEAINNNLLGYGPGADVYLIGTYTHNIFLEIAVEFGVFSLIVFIAFLIIKNTRFHMTFRHDYLRIKVLWLLFAISIIKLCFSGTFYTDPYIYIYLGYCVGGCRMTKYFIDSTNSMESNEEKNYDAIGTINNI